MVSEVTVIRKRGFLFILFIVFCLNVSRHISPDGYNIITDNGSLKDQKVILQNALNVST